MEFVENINKNNLGVEKKVEWYIGAIKKYAVFDGRTRRKEYWMFVLFNMIFAFIVSLLDELVFDSQEILFTLYRLFIFVPSLSVTVRRLHDVGKSGWFLLILLIPIIGIIWILILLCKDGEPGTNKYGENPKDNHKSGGFDDTIEQLKKLAELRDSGVLTEEEFAIQKEKILK